MHVRYQILEAVQKRLENVVGAVDGTVSLMRAGAIDEESQPHFTVLHTGETATPDGLVYDDEIDQGRVRYNRRLNVNVIVHFKGRSDPQKEFDQLALLIEEALPPSHLDGLAIDILLTASEMFIDPQTAQSFGSGRLIFEVTYRTYAGEAARTA